MTEKERQERIAKGYLWEDTQEYIAQQTRVKDLMYEFNMSRPSEIEKRNALVRQMFGSVGEDVWVNQPLTLAVGSTVTIGSYAVIGAGSIVNKDIPDYTVAVGNPCRPIRKIDEWDKEYYWKDRRFDEQM